MESERFNTVFTKVGLMNISCTLSFDVFNPQHSEHPELFVTSIGVVSLILRCAIPVVCLNYMVR